MVDRPPPSRYSVVERGGRLVVIDKETGQVPLTAAERMDLHDRKLGVEPIRPERASSASAPDMSAAARAESGLSARPAPQHSAKPAVPIVTADSGKARVAVAVAARNKQPWNAQPSDRPALKSNSGSAPSASRPAPQAGGARKTIVTGKWWDSKGPRTIELSPKGQQVLSSGFLALFVALVIAAVVALFFEPLLLFAGAFILFRFGGHILAPIGAGLIDKAIAERG